MISRARIPAALLAAALLGACGQTGALYLPDGADPAVPAEPVPASTPDVTSEGAPVVPTSPDRSDEPRQRIPSTPAPATSR